DYDGGCRAIGPEEGSDSRARLGRTRVHARGWGQADDPYRTAELVGSQLRTADLGIQHVTCEDQGTGTFLPCRCRQAAEAGNRQDLGFVQEPLRAIASVHYDRAREPALERNGLEEGSCIAGRTQTEPSKLPREVLR